MIYLNINPPRATDQMKKWTVNPKTGKPRPYRPSNVQAARDMLRTALLPHKPKEPYSGPVVLVVAWKFSYSKGHKDGEYKTTRPDTDNLQKALKDVMTELHFWHDDAQVVAEVPIKVWAKQPGICVEVRQLGRFYRKEEILDAIP